MWNISDMMTKYTDNNHFSTCFLLYCIFEVNIDRALTSLLCKREFLFLVEETPGEIRFPNSKLIVMFCKKNGHSCMRPCFIYFYFWLNWISEYWYIRNLFPKQAYKKTKKFESITLHKCSFHKFNLENIVSWIHNMSFLISCLLL